MPVKNIDISVNFKYGYGLIIDFSKAPRELRTLMDEYCYGGCFCHGINEFLETHLGIEMFTLHNMSSNRNDSNDFVRYNTGSCDHGDEYTPLYYCKRDSYEKSFEMQMEFKIENFMRPIEGTQLKRLKKIQNDLKNLNVDDSDKRTELYNESDNIQNGISNVIIMTDEQEKEVKRLIMEKIKQVQPGYIENTPPSYCERLDVLQKIHDWFFERGVDYPIEWVYEFTVDYMWNCQLCSKNSKYSVDDIWLVGDDERYKRFCGKFCIDCDWVHCYNCLTPHKIKKHNSKFPDHQIIKYNNCDIDRFRGLFLCQKAYQELLEYCKSKSQDKV
jgi:hypothetical protein